MNKTLEKFARDQIKEGLFWLDRRGPIYLRTFRGMYSHDNLERPINDIVDNMPAEKLDWALTQVQNSINDLEQS